MITGKILKYHHWPDDLIRFAKHAAEALEAQGLGREAILEQLEAVRAQPAAYAAHPVLGELARVCSRQNSAEASTAGDSLRERPLQYRVWGSEHIDPGAIAQMDSAMRLPVSVAGALMPDAHVGYGLPIGGVLATQATVIPFAVGVDIACFSGDTLIPLLDGNNYPLRELAGRQSPFFVYACQPDGKIVIAAASAVQTQQNAQLVEVTLDNGEKILCTPEHEFMLRDGTFQVAAKLQPTQALMPFYSQIDKDGYVQVQQNYSGRWHRVHWMVARSGLLGTIPKYVGQRTVIHHKDFNGANNEPANLKFMGARDHSAFHRSLVERNSHWQSEEFETRRKAALSAKAHTEDGHRYFAQRGGKNLKAYWEEDYERAKANCAGNGQRGKPFLVARNKSEKGKALSKVVAARLHLCDVCGEEVKSYIGLYNHRRLVHGKTGKLFNHKVISVRWIDGRQDVYCLVVPEYHNFAIAAGVFVHNCRMRLSVYEASPQLLGQKPGQFENALLEQTRFGMGAKWDKHKRPDHPVLTDPDWEATPLIRSLKNKAYEQLGTSGTGNHFVEWGVLKLREDDARLGLKPGDYLALLSHSGSRGVGFKIADHYSKLAQDLHPALDKSVRHLAWLDLDKDAGQEYWLSMELAGRFASANHYVIHHRVAAATGLKEIAAVENHHNFAWAETLADGTPVIVHRKGATPAGAGVLGLVPGSMGDAGYLVRGKGQMDALQSASHGAGRAMSRRAALNAITKTQRDAYLRERGITLLGGGLDEAPQAYKPVEAIIAAQEDLVDVLGRFTPKIVRMADEAGEY